MIDEQSLKHIAREFLNNRPLFFSVIRTPEAYLFNKHMKHLQGPMLDFGCGDGFFAKTAFPDHPIDVGLDIEQSRIQEAHQYNIYKDIVSYDGSTIPFKNNHFSTIISSSVLEHVPELDFSIREIFRVLKPNGNAYITVMTNSWEDYLVGTKIFGDTYRSFMKKKQDHFHLLTEYIWRKKFTSAGFTVKKATGYLTKENAPYLDIMHYPSIPSLITKKLFNTWVLFPNWYKLFNIDTFITDITLKGMKNGKNSGALFFHLTKTFSGK